ncbi:hypothetical protein AVEN_82311-1 [Araneus ventricosus]|uniref:Integrase catalytic domain-containing protein n=1 Tax=Araneus ventricosus TaxID=182803 RepID=A0A4Y2N9V7_ARAVE|nr:hypothetical protein AVEN_82311-1 [Araneus ventricosus]
MANLPPDRITETFPFAVTGLDYLGLLYYVENSESKKSYILLFTCAVARAVHLELSTDMSDPSFIRSSKKFVSRRGLCKIVYSDNAKTFLKMKKEFNILDKILKSEECQHYFGEMRITWKTNAPTGAWWGGFGERLVRSVKSSLKRILGKNVY